MTLNDSAIYGHFVKAWAGNGPLVVFYKCPIDWSPTEGFVTSQKLFGPNLVGIHPPIREGRWKVVGHIPILDYDPPLFLMRGPRIWWIYDGVKEKPIGERVPEEYQHLELLVGFPADLIEQGILEGTTSFSYIASMK